MEKKKCKIALCGFGNVAKGLFGIIQKQVDSIEVVVVFDRSYKKKQDLLGGTKATDKVEELFENTFDILVELIGGIDPALFIIREALDKKIPVVTANKSLLAIHGYALFQKSQTNQTPIFYEAAVVGAVPIVQNLKRYFSFDWISEFYGIVNGTTNYILTEMREQGLSFQDALQDAQQKGLAEANPKQDISGIDSKQKLALLGSIVSQRWVDWNNFYHHGIEDIHLTDIQWASSLGYKIKLLAIYKKSSPQKENESPLFLAVEPCLILKDSFLWNIEHETNAILLKTKISQDHLFIGPGAGPSPTAYAVYSDIMQYWEQTRGGGHSKLKFFNQYAMLSPIGDTKDSFYIRIRVKDIPGILSIITKLYSKHNISFAQIHQNTIGKDKKNSPEENLVDIIIITHNGKRSNIYNVIPLLKKEDAVQFVSHPIPIKKI